jgi:hypothetical protein
MTATLGSAEQTMQVKTEIATRPAQAMSFSWKACIGGRMSQDPQSFLSAANQLLKDARRSRLMSA